MCSEVRLISPKLAPFLCTINCRVFFYYRRHCNVQVVHPNYVQTDSYRSAASLSAFLNKCLQKYNSIDERSFAN